MSALLSLDMQSDSWRRVGLNGQKTKVSKPGNANKARNLTMTGKDNEEGSRDDEEERRDPPF